MIYVLAFLLSGFVCMIGQVILDNTKLTTGHITALFTALGALLSFLGVYPVLIEKCGTGATTLIMNFGNSLYQSAIEGYKNMGFVGIFSEMLCDSSLVVCSAIIFAFVITIFCKPKD